MKRQWSILVGLAVLGVLVFAVYRQNQKENEIGKPVAASSASLPTISAPDDADKISVTNGDKGEVVLEKKGDKWELTKPVSAPANQDSVKSVLSNLKEWKVKEKVNLAKIDDDLKKDKQLDAGHAVHVVAWKGGEKKTDLLFGKAGQIGQLAMVEGKDDAVYAVTGYSSWLFTKEAKDWRDKEIFKFDDNNATQVTIENKAGVFSFTKGDKGWAATLKGEPIARLDEQRVKDLLHDMKALNAEDFGDGKSATDTALDTPEGKLTIALKDGAGKYVLKVGKVTSNNSSHYATKDGDSTIFVIGKPSSDWALAEREKFQRPLDAGAADASTAGGPKKLDIPGMPGMPPGMPPGHPVHQ